MNYDYTVIGGGVSGMTSALILAKHGYSVALVEKSGQVAPTIRGFTRNGFHYTGSLGKGEPLDIFFRYLGLSDQVNVRCFDKDGFDSFRCLNPRFEFHFPYGYDSLTERFHQTFPDDGRAVDEYFRTVREIYASLPYVDLDSAGETAALSSVHGPSLKEFLDGLTGNDLLKCILSMHCFLYGVPPEETPFVHHACIAGSYYESASGIEGGGGSLTKAFEAMLEKAGVTVYCGLPVNTIHVAGDGAVSGISLEDGTNFGCKGCISTVHPQQFLKMVPESIFRPAYVNRLKQLDETTSACMFYATCSEPVKGLDRSNLFIFPQADFSFFHGSHPIERQPLYITAAGGGEGTGKHGFVAICPMPEAKTRFWGGSVSGKRPEGYTFFKKEMAERIGRSVEASCPEIAGKIIDREFATPLTLRDYTNSPYGSIYGVKHKVGQYNPIPVTRCRGLYLAGQAIVAPGIMGAMMSGFLACENIFGRDHLQEELKACRREG
jgi:all-trans-retinol 13,14-reductase